MVRKQCFLDPQLEILQVVRGNFNAKKASSDNGFGIVHHSGKDYERCVAAAAAAAVVGFVVVVVRREGGGGGGGKKKKKIISSL